jgi:4-diphosphocytidyl-2-C-methyl-D-erythritol kinase
MHSTERRVRVKSYAKVNLDLRVLWRRSDGFHELRSLFHTISLADDMEMRWRSGDSLSVVTACPAIPLVMEDNLAHRAALRYADAVGLRGSLLISVQKRIPMGGGLGGGSSNAAAVLLALPALTGTHLPGAPLLELAESLGSDVPFFLQGGAAVGIGRGEELFPLPDFPPLYGLLVAPGIAVPTPAAYKALRRPALPLPAENHAFATLKREFSAQLLTPPDLATQWNGSGLGRNDFESVVFADHPELARWKSRLLEAGASHAMMSGSGSTVFGLFPSRDSALMGQSRLGSDAVHAFQLVPRSRYHRDWLRRLGLHTQTALWPPQPPQ